LSNLALNPGSGIEVKGIGSTEILFLLINDKRYKNIHSGYYSLNYSPCFQKPGAQILKLIISQSLSSLINFLNEMILSFYRYSFAISTI